MYIHIYIYVCIDICIYVFTHLSIYLYIFVLIYFCIYMFLYTCTHKALQFWSTFSHGYWRRDLPYVHIRTHTHFYRHTHLSPRPFISGALSPRANSIHKCIYVYIHTHIHTYIRTYIQMYVYIHTNTHPCRSCTLSPRQIIGEIIRTYTRMYTHTCVHIHTQPPLRFWFKLRHDKLYARSFVCIPDIHSPICQPYVASFIHTYTYSPTVTDMPDLSYVSQIYTLSHANCTPDLSYVLPRSAVCQIFHMYTRYT